MNTGLKAIMVEHTPKINKKITDGTAKQILATMPQYLDAFFTSGLGSLSPKIPFTYLGYRRMHPREEYERMTLGRDGTVPYDLSQNNVYGTEFRFEYDGKLISRPLYLIYCDEKNILVMGGANNHITPVLSDTVISPSINGVFMRLLKAKLNFSSKVAYFVVDGEKIPGNIINGEILKSKKIVDMLGRPLTSTSLYLLGKYGLVETLKKYGGVDEVMVTTGNVDARMEGFSSYTTVGSKPRGLKTIPYIPHTIVIHVRGSNINKSFVDNLLYGVIYTLDILPDTSSDMVNLITSGNVSTEIKFWRIVLGRVIYKNSFSVDRISQDLDDHFQTLEGYIDALINTKLKEAGIHVNNFFDLLALLLTEYDNWVSNSKEYNANIENRYIDILYYITYDIIIGFNRVILSLNKRITKTNSISYKEVSKILTNELGSKRIYGLTKSTEPNLAVTSVDNTSDIAYTKVTSILEDQSRGNGVKRGKKSTIPESAKTLKSDDLGFGSLLFLGKNLPSPRFKMNMFMDYSVNTGKILYPDKTRVTLEKLSRLLQGIGPNINISATELESESFEENDL